MLKEVEKQITMKRRNSKEKNNDDQENLPRRRSQRLLGNDASVNNAVESKQKLFQRPELPFIKYDGTIKYYTEGHEIAEASDSILQWVDKQVETDTVPLSFDMEWPFSFQTGPGKSSTIQICVDISCCYVFHLSKLKKIPAALVALLNHPKVRPHGVNVKNDFRKLARDFPEVNVDAMVAKCIDLGSWCNEICETGGRWSLERLTHFIVRQGIDKSKKVRMSKWHVVPLDENQLLYAAIDVYVGQLIYMELNKRQETKQKNEDCFKQANGESAFKALKSLGETFLEPVNNI